MPGTVRSRSYLEDQYATGDRPTATDFADLFASFISANDTDVSPCILGSKIFSGSIQLSGSALVATAKGNVLVGTLTQPTTGSPVFVMAQLPASINPTGMPADSGGMFVKSITGTAEVCVIDEAGNVTPISPHAFAMFTPHPTYEFPFSYHSENNHLGIQIEVDMFGAIRALERLTGQQFIHLDEIERQEWTSSKSMPKWLAERVKRIEKTPELSPLGALHKLSFVQRISKWCKKPFRLIHKIWMYLIEN